jgi:PTS system nitrogen regulatory IIA component
MLMISPADKGGEYLQTLARVSRILKQSSNRQRLVDCATRDEIVALFASDPGTV